MEETNENRIVAGLQTDSSGKPKDGVLITPTQNNTYTLQLYLKGKLMKTVEKISFDKVDEEIRNIEEYFLFIVFT